jgi:phosphohistidine phosphatase
LQRLILMRHGRAAPAPKGGGDQDRPLTPDGRADSRLIGQALAKADLSPHKAYVSAATRTRQTWAAASEAFPKARAHFRSDLYHADPGHLLALVEIEAADEAQETVMIVGHNPGLHALAVHLLKDSSAPASIIGRMERGFPTATAAAFLADAAGRMHYDGLFLAHELGGGAGE